MIKFIKNIKKEKKRYGKGNVQTSRGGATLLTACSMGFGGIRWKRLLRYYDIKALRSNSRVSKSDLQYVILNLFQDLAAVTQRKPRPRISNTRKLVLKFNPRSQGVGRCFVSEAHSKNLVPYCLSNLVSSKKAAFTLAEGATHVDMSDNIRRVAFTLAEVLITLGIIGIVAAMTIPTLIVNYQKKQTVSKLKQTYSIISQALTMAQSEHGDTTTWEVGGIYDTPTASPNFNHEDAVKKFVTKYFIPYLKVSKDFGYTRLSEIDYEGDYLPATGIVSNSRGAYGYILLLSSNVLVRIGIGTGCLDNEQNPDGTCVTRVYKNIIFKVDINGFDKPNVIGKDVFNMTFDLRKKAFGFHNYGSSTRQSVLNNCKTDENAQICGYLIFLDGWEIKDDYPWF